MRFAKLFTPSKVVGVRGVVLATNQLERVADFYIRLGVPLKRHAPTGMPVFYDCDWGASHFALYEAGPRHLEESNKLNAGGSTRIELAVENLDEVYAQALSAGASVAIEPEESGPGRRAVLLDPDSRPVEITEI